MSLVTVGQVPKKLKINLSPAQVNILKIPSVDLSLERRDYSYVEVTIFHPHLFEVGDAQIG